jgi:alpha-tubulin suppressor-like RCC1 family protein
VTCWGNSDVGQLGSATATGPTVVALAGEAVDVEAGGEHACAVLASGAVQCWGSQADGRLGHSGAGVGTVPLPEPVASIALGAAHGCAITEQTESLHCWGSDEHGQLATGVDSSAGIRRVDLEGLRAEAVFTGSSASTTFVVLEGGNLRGFGRNDAGQAGYGDLLGEQQESRKIGNLPDIPIFRAPK